ncbi:MAG: twin-arginine translocase subunit TatC [Chloroflexi bacterium]|nr:twin-arginine translocase subunit TatC [Chloroflexota bacterium]MCI0574765.1 twin-arginine translocase subunit TatC [Chloroflexota bacterium]MCI0646404.1 twin-arginine translocase subunit TatC [Chloroflexota bacterium]MCI0725505.1 twin-arginine translocase subunit TatC [Chloroflexota bacterium]
MSYSTADAGQTILQHLNELRIRLTWAAAGLALATAVSFSFAQQVLDFLKRPYGKPLQVLRPTEGLEIYFKVALACGAILSMPWLLYQTWLFIAPGLFEREKKYVFIFVPSATLLFLLGVTFAWLVLMPAAVTFLSGFMPDTFNAEWTAQEYVGFATTFLFWIGVSFEMPLVIYFLARFGVVSATTLREQWRMAVVGIAVVAAAITPSIDPVTMLLTMAPLVLLYLLSILLARIGQRQYEKSVALEVE